MSFTKHCPGWVTSLALLFVALTSPLYSQNVVTGDVTGTITDPSGAVVPNAKVELKSAESGFDKTVTTGGAGDFRFSLLKPGPYTIAVSNPAFSTVTRKITVNLGQVTNASTALSVGASTTTVEVTGEAPILQTDNGNVTTTFDTRAVAQLPNPGGRSHLLRANGTRNCDEHQRRRIRQLLRFRSARHVESLHRKRQRRK